MTSNEVTATVVQELLVDRLAAVLGVDAGTIDAATRFDEDLHADSLDLVEVVEGVERALVDRGVTLTVPDEDLAAFTTVGDAVERITAQASRG